MSEDDVSDEVIIKVTDYLEGTLPASERADIEAKIASDPAWKATHDEMVEARKMISGMQKARPPATFTEDVTATIHKRSAGRFFARRTLGDRVPFGVLLIIALLAFAVVGYFMWSSPTGSLKQTKQPAPAKHQQFELHP
jgi:anti-sigma factor RsiW